MAYRGTPTVRDGVLTTTAGEKIRVESSEWFSWLQSATSFSYTSRQLSTDRIHMRKRKVRNRYYWYGHMKRESKLYNKYAGPSARLTSSHLDQVGQSLLQQWRSQRCRKSVG